MADAKVSQVGGNEREGELGNTNRLLVTSVIQSLVSFIFSSPLIFLSSSVLEYDLSLFLKTISFEAANLHESYFYVYKLFFFSLT